MTEIPRQEGVDLTELLVLINAEVRAAMDEVEKQAPANLRITSVRVAFGQGDTEGTPPVTKEEIEPADATPPPQPVLRQGRYSLSKQGWIVEMAFGGGGGPAILRQRGGQWLPLPKPAPPGEATQRRDTHTTEAKAVHRGWVRRFIAPILLVLLQPLKLAGHLICRLANRISHRAS